MFIALHELVHVNYFFSRRQVMINFFVINFFCEKNQFCGLK